jgi:hypothetical protein
MTEIMKDYPEAGIYIKDARKKYIFANIIGVPGFFIFGWTSGAIGYGDKLINGNKIECQQQNKT